MLTDDVVRTLQLESHGSGQFRGGHADMGHGRALLPLAIVLPVGYLGGARIIGVCNGTLVVGNHAT